MLLQRERQEPQREISSKQPGPQRGGGAPNPKFRKSNEPKVAPKAARGSSSHLRPWAEPRVVGGAITVWAGPSGDKAGSGLVGNSERRGLSAPEALGGVASSCAKRTSGRV